MATVTNNKTEIVNMATNECSEKIKPRVTRINQNKVELEASFKTFPASYFDLTAKESRVRLLKSMFGYVIKHKNIGLGLKLYDFFKTRCELRTSNDEVNDNFVCECQKDDCHYIQPKQYAQNLIALFYLIIEFQNNPNEDTDNYKAFIPEMFNFLKNNGLASENLYSLMIKHYCLAGQHQSAYSLLDVMVQQDERPHLRSYRPLIETAPNIEFLEKVYTRLKRQLLVPDVEFYELLFIRLSHFTVEVNSLLFELWQPYLKDYLEYHQKISKDMAQLFRQVFGEKMCMSTEVSRHGICYATGDQLKSIDITPTQRKTLANLVYRLGASVFQSFNKFINRQNFNYDIVLDGANIGLYNNVDFTVARLMKASHYYMTKGKKVLIILNHKRKTEELHFFSEINKNLLIYYVPSGVNDDLVWLYACLHTEGKLGSGYEIMVVTNDKMADHIYYTFPEYFKTWIERHQITFDFDKKSHRLSIVEPSQYSKRIQIVNGRWYFPIEDTSNDWILISPNAF